MASSITIKDEDLTPLKDQVVIVTGGSSGIGLATVRLLLRLNAKVVVGDRNSPPEDVASSVLYVKVDVISWEDQRLMFQMAYEVHGRIDHVFANAGKSPGRELGRSRPLTMLVTGIQPLTNFMEDEMDSDGELVAPNLKVFHVNLFGEIYSVKLAIHYMRKQESGGSIVLTGSASSFQQMMCADYTCAKTGVMGLMRGMMHLLHPHLPIRINMMAPQWAGTNIAPAEAWDSIKAAVASPDFVARKPVFLMADRNRHGQFLFSDMGVVKEIEGPMNDLAKTFLESDQPGWMGLNEAIVYWQGSGQTSHMQSSS